MRSPTDRSQPPAPVIPDSLMTASAEEQTALALAPLDGTGPLPADLGGHVFFVAPVGGVDSIVDGYGLPRADGTTIFNGNGMVFRLDFDGSGGVAVTSRLAKTPDYYADLITYDVSLFAPLRFNDMGLVRFGILGSRNQINTAFVPMLQRGQPPRLILTWDAGRPYEIDPATLDLVTPVGTRDEWKATLFSFLPFPVVLATAHPCFDSRTGELYGVNYGRSLLNFAGMGGYGRAVEDGKASGPPLVPPPGLSPILLADLDRLCGEAADAIDDGRPFPEIDRAMDAVVDALSKLGRDGRPLKRLAEIKFGGTPTTGAPEFDLFGENFVRLVRWNGSGPLEVFNLVMPDQSPVVILNTMHQIAITRSWVVLMDTAFKFGLETLFNNPFPNLPRLERLLRWLLTNPQISSTPVYLVRRADLKAGVSTVVVKPLSFTPESVHVLADYDDLDDRITIYCQHNAATDISEWLRAYDQSPGTRENPPQILRGLISVGQMDLNRLGRHVIDAATGTLVESKILTDVERGLAYGLYSLRETQDGDQQHDRLETLYWAGLGLWDDMSTKFIDRLYARYPNRILPLMELHELRANGGLQGSILRIDCGSMSIVDAYLLPAGNWLCSLQFVPGKSGGYLVTTVATTAPAPGGSEIWIFDANNLAAGPKWKRGASGLSFGFTLHTAYLAEVAPRACTYDVPVEKDYADLGPRLDEQARDFIEKYVIPAACGKPTPA